ICEADTIHNFKCLVQLVGCDQDGLVRIEHCEPQDECTRTRRLTLLTTGETHNTVVLLERAQHVLLEFVWLEWQTTEFWVLDLHIVFNEVEAIVGALLELFYLSLSVDVLRVALLDDIYFAGTGHDILPDTLVAGNDFPATVVLLFEYANA